VPGFFKTVDLYKIREFLGHRKMTMTVVYAHDCPESLRASVEVLDDYYNFSTIAGKELTGVCKTA